MQPRRDLFPRGEMVFQVTKSGYSSSLGRAAGEGCWDRRLPKEKKEVLEEDLDASPRAARDDAVEREDGVEEDEPDEGEGTWRRLILGRRRPERAGFGGSSSASSSSSPSSRPSISLSLSPKSSPSCETGSSSSWFSESAALSLFKDWYCVHRSCTRRYSRGSRSSRSAARTSKQ